QIRELLQKLPEARWHQWEAVNYDNALEGARMAFGEPLATHYRLESAAIIVSFASDFLHGHPNRLRHIREFSDGRRVVAGHAGMNRLYVVESSPSMTGSMADHRLILPMSEMAAAAQD